WPARMRNTGNGPGGSSRPPMAMGNGTAAAGEFGEEAAAVRVETKGGAARGPPTRSELQAHTHEVAPSEHVVDADVGVGVARQGGAQQRRIAVEQVVDAAEQLQLPGHVVAGVGVEVPRPRRLL